MKTITNKEFNQNAGKAVKHLDESPVLVTRRGKPFFVLQSYADWQRQQDKPAQSLFDAFTHGTAAAADIDLDIPPRSKVQRRPVDLEG